MKTEAMVNTSIVNGLPKGWRWEPLSEVTDNLDNKRKPINAAERETRQGDVPYYGATGQVGWIDKHLLDEEVVLVGEDGAPFLDPGRVKAYMVSGKSWVNNHAHVLRAKDGMPNAYLMHYLNILDYAPYVSGTTRLKLTKGAMNKIPVPVAPLPEQRRIVSAIETQLGRLDAAVALLHAAKAKLKRYKQAVLKAAVEGRLTEADLSEGELPSGWELTTLGEAVELVSGGTPKGLNESATGGEIPFFKVGDMTLDGNDRYMESSRTYLTAVEAKRLKLAVHPVGTVIFPKRGGAILTNKKRVLSTPGAFDLNLMGALPNEEVNGDYLYYWFEQLDLSKIYDGSNIPQINKKNVDPLPFAKPPVTEQLRIVEELDRLVNSSNETEATLDAQLQQASRLRQSVLKRAFKGRLV